MDGVRWKVSVGWKVNVEMENKLCKVKIEEVDVGTGLNIRFLNL